MTAAEEWLPVVGYEGLYEVSSLGRVWSVPRVVERGAGHYTVRGGMLTPGWDPDARDHGRYPHVTLCKPQRTLQVHHLVLEAFVGPCPEGQEGCHGDGDPDSCALSNLRWGTHSDNMRDQVEHGTHHFANRTRCPRRHRLVRPNLAPAALRAGVRRCLACRRAINSAHVARRTDRPFDVRAEADRHYVKIMSSAAADPEPTGART